MDALAVRDGRLTYRGVPFSGVAYARDSDGSVQANRVNEGHIGARYRPPFLPTDDAWLEIDFPHFASEDDEPIVDGKPFSGISYTFQGDWCCRELLTIDGAPVVDAWLDRDGRHVSVAIHWAGRSEIYEWHRGDPGLRSLSVSTSSHYSGFIRFLREGRIDGLGSRNGFVKALTRLLQESAVDVAAALDAFHAWNFAERIMLHGSDIDDGFLLSLCERRAFDGVRDISLSEAAVSEVALAALMRNPGLRRLEVRERDIARRQALEHLRAADSRGLLHLV